MHKNSNDNELRLINFSTTKSVVVISTWMEIKNVHKETWYSPDGVIQNELLHAITESRNSAHMYK